VPTYQNVSTVPQYINGKVVDPGKEICSLAYYDENIIKLLKVSDKPFYNPIILSEKYDKNIIVQIPTRDHLGVYLSKYTIHFCVKKGNVKIWYNSRENDPCLHLYTDARWNTRVFERNIDKICVDGMDNFELWVIVEQLP
jgi:hypothetical protein